MNLNMWASQAKAAMGITHGSRAFGGPVSANLSLSNRCNIRCIHCFYYSPYIDKPTLPSLRKARLMSEELPDAEHLKNLQRFDADTEKFRNFIDELLSMGTRRYELGAFGEIFLHKDVMELIGRLKHSGSYCWANTNGILLDCNKIDELIKMGFDELKITTMAGTSDMYVETHPGISDKTFNKIRENLLYLNEKKASLGVQNPKITLVFIVITENCEGIIDFTEFAARVGAACVEFRTVKDVGDAGLAKLVPNKEQAASVAKQLTEAKVYLENRGIHHNINCSHKTFCEELNTTELYKHIPCYYGWLSLVVDGSGEVYPCCRCYKSFGNIYKNNFREIWNGEAYRRFRKEAMLINKRKTPVSGCGCNSCVHYIANLRVYRTLHPLKGRSSSIKRVCPEHLGDEGT